MLRAVWVSCRESGDDAGEGGGAEGGGHMAMPGHHRPRLWGEFLQKDRLHHRKRKDAPPGDRAGAKGVRGLDARMVDAV